MGERFVNGSSEVHELGDAKGLPQDISPDGKQVLTMLMNDGIFTSRLEGTAQERAPQAIVHTGETAWGPGFSPDGRWIVYSVRGSRESDLGDLRPAVPRPCWIADTDCAHGWFSRLAQGWQGNRNCPWRRRLVGTRGRSGQRITLRRSGTAVFRPPPAGWFYLLIAPLGRIARRLALLLPAGGGAAGFRRHPRQDGMGEQVRRAHACANCDSFGAL